MKVINNRYRIEKSLYNDYFVESYKVKDLLSQEFKYMKIYHYSLKKELIDYFVNNQIKINNIRHESIFYSEKFNIVNTIDSRNINIIMYYSISEFVKQPTTTLAKKVDDLNFHERLRILLDIIFAIDFLHFRGFVYRYLNPLQIFILDNGTIKLLDIPSILEKLYNNEYTEFERRFLSPDVVSKEKDTYTELDYYSLARIIEYMFLDNTKILENTSDKLDNKGALEFLNELILELEVDNISLHSELNKKTLSLLEIAERIIGFFDIDYKYDLIKEREKLFFEKPIVGREAEISKIIKLDDHISKRDNYCNYVLISGECGIGKTNLVKEIQNRMTLRNRKAYFIDVEKKSNGNMQDIANLVRMTMKDAPDYLKEKYSYEFSNILPELNQNKDNKELLEIKNKAKQYRIYNRIANYLRELSTSKNMYIILDDIQNSNDEFSNFLEYLIDNLEGSNIIFLITINKDMIEKNINLKSKNEQLIIELKASEIKLDRLNLEETGQLIKGVLGMSYAPQVFSNILFKESQGNPKRIEELIDYLYFEKKLYMHKNGRWTLGIDSYSQLNIPTTINDAISLQLSKIEDKYLEIIKVMSAFEGFISKDIFAGMLNMESRKIDEIIKDLVEMEIIEEKQINTIYNYNIKNVDLKKYVYYELEENTKIEMHKKAAKEIEKAEKSLDESLFEEYIYHLLNSKQKYKALERIQQKISTLDNKNGYETKHLLEKSYNILGTATESILKLEILQKLLDIELDEDVLKEDNAYLDEYIKIAENLDSEFHKLNYKRLNIELLYKSGRKDLCQIKLEEIKTINKASNIADFKVHYLILSAKIDLNDGWLKSTQDKLNEAIEISIENNLSDQLGTLYNILGVTEYLSGDPHRAKKNYEKSYEYFEADKDIMGSLKVVNNLGNIYKNQFNDSKKAIDFYQKGLDISKRCETKKPKSIFLINITEVNIFNYDFEIAFKNISEANQLDLGQKETKLIVECQSLLGKVYLEKEQLDKTYDCYTYLKNIYGKIEITDLELLLSYYSFIGEFYFYFGQWKNALKYINMSKELAIQFDKRKYYMLKFKSILVKSYLNKKNNKAILDEYMDEYKKTIYIEGYREAVLLIALLSINVDDYEYANKYLEYDNQIKDKVQIDFLNKLRSIIEIRMSLNEDNLNKLIVELESDFKNKSFPFRVVINSTIASIFEKNKKYKEAIKYNIMVMEDIYKNAIKIPEWSLKISYIKSRNIDKIKENIRELLNKEYGLSLYRVKTEDISYEEDYDALANYFDLTEIIEAVGKKEFSQINNIHSYGDTLKVEGIDSLVAMFKNDYKYNLDLILNYISKEAMANKAFILEYNKEIGGYDIITSIDKDENHEDVNDGILKLSTITEKGLLIKNNLENSLKRVYKNFLSRDIFGLICVPIYFNKFSSQDQDERRLNRNLDQGIMGYIYLETDRVYSGFSDEILELIDRMLYLIYINIENNKLRYLATTDKLTGVMTRKYYDEKFDELIESRQGIEGAFSVLLLDVDKFKRINDNYGHQRGDDVLRGISEIINSSVRSTDVVGRYGGEEFIVLLKDTGEEEALNIAEDIRKKIELFNIEGIKCPITISIGISLYPNHSKLKEELVEKADQALYHSKQMGRNRISLWNHKMDGVFKRVDKLAGLLAGTSEIDNKNILGIVNIVQLIKEKSDLKNKIYKYLGELLNIIDSETATIIILDKNEKKYYSRIRSHEEFVDIPVLNDKIIDRAIKDKKDEFLIDWDNLVDVDPDSGIPNWKSVIVVPMIKNGEVMGLTYLSTSLNKKEFDFQVLNLAKNCAGIFVAVL